MNSSQLCNGMIVDFQNQAVEVVEVNPDSGLVEVRNCSSYKRSIATCDQLNEDPQLHTDSLHYY